MGNDSVLTNEDLPERPCIKKSIYVNDLFLNTKNNGYYIYGELESDSQFLIPAKQKEAMDKLVDKLDGKHTISEISEETVANQHLRLYATFHIALKNCAITNICHKQFHTSILQLIPSFSLFHFLKIIDSSYAPRSIAIIQNHI